MIEKSKLLCQKKSNKFCKFEHFINILYLIKKTLKTFFEKNSDHFSVKLEDNKKKTWVVKNEEWTFWKLLSNRTCCMSFELLNLLSLWLTSKKKTWQCFWQKFPSRVWKKINTFPFFFCFSFFVKTRRNEEKKVCVVWLVFFSLCVSLWWWKKILQIKRENYVHEWKKKLFYHRPLPPKIK